MKNYILLVLLLTCFALIIVINTSKDRNKTNFSNGTVTKEKENLEHLGDLSFYEKDYLTSLNHYIASAENKNNLSAYKAAYICEVILKKEYIADFYYLKFETEGTSSDFYCLAQYFEKQTSIFPLDKKNAEYWYKKAKDRKEEEKGFSSTKNTTASFVNVVKRVYSSNNSNNKIMSYYLENDKNSTLFLQRYVPRYANAEIDYFKKGNQCYEDNDFEKALYYYSKAIELNNSFSEAYNNRGLVYSHQRKIELAFSDFNKAIEIKDNPSTASSAHNNRGILFSDLKDYKKSFADFSKAIELDSSLGKAYYNRGTLNQLFGDFEAALENYSKAISFEPLIPSPYYCRSKIYQKQKKFAEALKDSKIAVKLNPAKVEYIENLGDSYFLAKDYENAIKQYQLALKKQKVSSIYKLGYLYETIYKDESKSVPYYEQFEKIGNSIEFYILGKHFNDGDEIFPTNREKALYWHSKFLTRGNEEILELSKKSMADILTSKSNNPLETNDLELQNNKQTEVKTEKDKNEIKTSEDNLKENKIIKYYSAIIDKNSANFQAYFNRGIAYSKLQNYDKAILDFSKTLELDPSFSEAYNNRGYAYMYQQKYELALKDIKKATELEPDNDNFCDSLGDIYFWNKEYENAVKQYEYAANKNRIVCLYKLGYIYDTIYKNDTLSNDYYKKFELKGTADDFGYISKCFSFGKDIFPVNKDKERYWKNKTEEKGKNNSIF